LRDDELSPKTPTAESLADRRARRWRMALWPLALAVLVPPTCWAVATVSPWLVPLYLLVILGTIYTPGGRPASRLAGSRVIPQSEGASDRAGVTNDVEDSSRTEGDRPLGEADVREEAPPAMAEGVATAPSKVRRGRGRAKGKPKAAPEPTQAAWVRVGPGKFVRVEGPNTISESLADTGTQPANDEDDRPSIPPPEGPIAETEDQSSMLGLCEGTEAGPVSPFEVDAYDGAGSVPPFDPVEVMSAGTDPTINQAEEQPSPDERAERPSPGPLEDKAIIPTPFEGTEAAAIAEPGEPLEIVEEGRWEEDQETREESREFAEAWAEDADPPATVGQEEAPCVIEGGENSVAEAPEESPAALHYPGLCKRSWPSRQGPATPSQRRAYLSRRSAPRARIQMSKSARVAGRSRGFGRSSLPRAPPSRRVGRGGLPTTGRPETSIKMSWGPVKMSGPCVFSGLKTRWRFPSGKIGPEGGATRPPRPSPRSLTASRPAA
jgi:hypothetical protein